MSGGSYILGAPGTEYGPCAEPCAHQGCTQARAAAAQVCPRCRQPMGYDTVVWDSDGGLEHDVCPTPTQAVAVP